MTFTEIFNEVVSLTNHEEMVAEITSAIKAATLRMHQSDYYERDVAEARVILAPSTYADYTFQFDYAATMARFRHIKYLRKWNPAGNDPNTGASTGAAGAFFKFLDPDNIVNGQNVEKTNVAYIAGRYLNIRSSTSLYTVLAGWYQNPFVTDTTKYLSWVADQVPYAIIFDAASIIFQMLAQQDQARKFDQLVMEQLQMVRSIGIALKGY